LTLGWILTVLALAAAALALLRTRQLSRRLDRLAESYWDLRYEYGQLHARVVRLEPADEAGSHGPPQAQQPQTTTAFVPLSSLRR
jgi:hypothetical protein